jgi:hypothetical protein
MRPATWPRLPHSQSWVQTVIDATTAEVPELTITYEDAAEVILDNLSKGGRFSHRRVGVALPPGLRKHKDDVPR